MGKAIAAKIETGASMSEIAAILGKKAKLKQVAMRGAGFCFSSSWVRRTKLG